MTALHSGRKERADDRSQGGSHRRGLENQRALLAVVSGCFGLGLCVLFYYVLPEQAAKVMIDRNGLIYPFSVQNCMWVVFCVASGELALRMRAASREMRQLRMRYLPEDPRVVLQAGDLPDIYRRVREDEKSERRFLPRLIARCILQFQISSSVEQCASLMNTTLDLIAHELDLHYSASRYITWLIPRWASSAPSSASATPCPTPESPGASSNRRC